MWSKTKPYLMVLPACVMVGAVFGGGLWNGLLQSLGYFPAAGEYEWTTEAYRTLLFSPDFWQSLLHSLKISLIATLLSAVIGVGAALAFLLDGTGRREERMFKWFQLPLVIPHLVAGYMMVLLLMQSGWFSGLFYHFGWIEGMREFPVVINDAFGWGIILTYVWKEAPFIALMVSPVVIRIRRSWSAVARVHGASYLGFVREVVIPLLLPTCAFSSFIVFAFTLTAFEIPYLLGVTYPKMLAVFSYDLYTAGGLAERPQALAANVMMVLVTLFVGGIVYRLCRRWIRMQGGGW